MVLADVLPLRRPTGGRETQMSGAAPSTLSPKPSTEVTLRLVSEAKHASQAASGAILAGWD